MLLKESGCMCARWLDAAFCPCLLFYSFEKLITMATACVQCLWKGHPSCLHPKTFAPLGSDWTKAWDANHPNRTANNYSSLIRDRIAHGLCWKPIKYLNQECNAKSALWAWILSLCTRVPHWFENHDGQYWQHRMMHRLLSVKERGVKGSDGGVWFGCLCPSPHPSIHHCFIILCSSLKLTKGSVKYENGSSLTGKCTAAAYYCQVVCCLCMQE